MYDVLCWFVMIDNDLVMIDDDLFVDGRVMFT